MKFIQAAVIALPAFVSGGSRSRDRSRDRASLGDRVTGNRAGILGAKNNPIVGPVCDLLETQIEGVGLQDVTCNCRQPELTKIEFDCTMDEVELQFSDDKDFIGDFGLEGSFALDVFEQTYTLGLGSCFNGVMNLTDLPDPVDLDGCANVEICPDQNGNFDEFCGCGGTLSGYNCTCVQCSDGNTGVIFDCDGLPFDLDLCFPDIRLPF